MLNFYIYFQIHYTCCYFDANINYKVCITIFVLFFENNRVYTRIYFYSDQLCTVHFIKLFFTETYYFVENYNLNIYLLKKLYKRFN